MLTDSEKKWLEERKKLDKDGWGYLCAHCENKTDEYHSCYLEVIGGFCPTDSWCQNFVDAAEFEARVAAKLSRMDWEDVPCAHGMSLFCPKKGGPHVDCGAWCLMREARLTVEEEMDNENHS